MLEGTELLGSSSFSPTGEACLLSMTEVQVGHALYVFTPVTVVGFDQTEKR